VGVVYSGALAGPLAAEPGLVDALSLIPEILWHEAPDHPRYRWIGRAVELFDAAVADSGPVFHGIGLSLGSGLPLNLDHLEQIIAAAERYRPSWYSEHLAAFRVTHSCGRRVHAGVGLPVPLDGPTLRYLVPKVATVVSQCGLPFLLENNAIYVAIPEADMTEAGFLNRLCDETGAGVLLDLHNLAVNEVNLGWPAEEFLAELDLTRVVEIHVAGGEMLGRWYTDAHSGACPERVWALLDQVLPHAPALRLVTFELHESRLEPLGWPAFHDEVDRIRSVTARTVAGVA
jgi:uncharacterized protein (UPF0276 family)